MSKIPKLNNIYEFQAMDTYLRTGNWLPGLTKSTKDTLRKKITKFFDTGK